MGTRAVLVGGLADPAGWALAVRAAHLPGVVDVVPGAQTVLIACTDPTTLVGVRVRLPTIDAAAAGAGPRTLVTIRVRYDGPDLAAVAAALGLAADELVTRHSGAEYTAAFCGFSPGFAYLSGLPDELRLPRRASPRTRVPAGSVAIAGEYSAVYPRVSPGGWHLLGTTEATLFDAGAEPPALIQPGDRVRFVPC